MTADWSHRRQVCWHKNWHLFAKITRVSTTATLLSLYFILRTIAENWGCKNPTFCLQPALLHQKRRRRRRRRRRVDGGRQDRTMWSVSSQSWPPQVQQPENLNEIFRASVLSAVRWSRQTVGLHDVMPAVWLGRTEQGGQVTCAAVAF